MIIEDTDNQFITTRIKDTGIGMPEEEIEKVFDKFYQVTKPRSAKSRGTSLGLTIAKTTVELHGGKIWIKSEEGKGSDFFLPCQWEDHNEKEDSCSRR